MHTCPARVQGPGRSKEQWNEYYARISQECSMYVTIREFVVGGVVSLARKWQIRIAKQ